MYGTILPSVLVAYYLFFLSLSLSVVLILSFCILLFLACIHTHIHSHFLLFLSSYISLLRHAHTNRHATRIRHTYTHTLERIQARIIRTRTADGRNGGYKASLKTAFLSVNVKVCTTYEALAP